MASKCPRTTLVANRPTAVGHEVTPMNSPVGLRIRKVTILDGGYVVVGYRFRGQLDPRLPLQRTIEAVPANDRLVARCPQDLVAGSQHERRHGRVVNGRPSSASTVFRHHLGKLQRRCLDRGHDFVGIVEYPGAAREVVKTVGLGPLRPVGNYPTPIVRDENGTATAGPCEHVEERAVRAKPTDPSLAHSNHAVTDLDPNGATHLAGSLALAAEGAHEFAVAVEHRDTVVAVVAT